MSGTSVPVRIASAFVGLWVVALTAVSSMVAALAQTGAQNVPGDVHLWELARRVADGASPVLPAAQAPAGDAYLYELAQRVGEQAPVTAGTDWTWAIVAGLAAVLVLAVTMLVVTARRHHWHVRMPVRHGHA